MRYNVLVERHRILTKQHSNMFILRSNNFQGKFMKLIQYFLLIQKMRNISVGLFPN